MERDPRFVEAATAAIQLSEMPLELVHYIARMSAGTLMNLAQTMPEIAELAQKNYVWKTLFERDFPNEFNFCGGYVPFYVVDAKSPAFAWIINRADAEGPPWKRFYLHVRQMYVETAKALQLDDDDDDGFDFAHLYRSVRKWVESDDPDTVWLFSSCVLNGMILNALGPSDRRVTTAPIYNILGEPRFVSWKEDKLKELVSALGVDLETNTLFYDLFRIAEKLVSDKPVFMAYGFRLEVNHRGRSEYRNTSNVFLVNASCMWAARYLSLKDTFERVPDSLTLLSDTAPFFDGIVPIEALEKLFVSQRVKERTAPNGTSTTVARLFGTFFTFLRNATSNKIVYMKRDCMQCNKAEAGFFENSSRPRFFCNEACQQKFYSQ